MSAPAATAGTPARRATNRGEPCPASLYRQATPKEAARIRFQILGRYADKVGGVHGAVGLLQALESYQGGPHDDFWAHAEPVVQAAIEARGGR